MTGTHPALAWISADAGSMAVAALAIAASAFVGYRQGLFLGIVAVLACLTGLCAGVALAPQMATALARLGWLPGILLPLSFFTILFTTLLAAKFVMDKVCGDEDVWLLPIVDRVGGAVMGTLAGGILGGGVLIGWSMCEVPIGVRSEKPVQSSDLGAWALRVFARLAEPRGEDRDKLLGGDTIRGKGQPGGEVVYATEPFDDVDGDRRRGEDERFIDYDGDDAFTVDQQVTDHPKGEAKVRDTGLLDRYWLSAWRRMRVLHPPRITSRLFVVIAEEAQKEELVYHTTVDDPDPDEKHQFSLKENDEDQSNLLMIDAATGDVRFRDQEIDSKLRKVRFTIRVEDGSGLTDERQVEVTLRPPE